jgi:hypothetical protein
MIRSIVSGGQTGVDRAALVAAIALGLPCGGWCPRGRLAEDGPIAECFPLRETPSDDYAQRTEWNVRDSDATLVLSHGRMSGGTAFTVEIARRMRKNLLVLDLIHSCEPEIIARWAEKYGIETLNVAGPRESQRPGIYELALRFLLGALGRGLANTARE